MMEMLTPKTGDPGEGSLPMDNAGEIERDACLVDDVDKLHGNELP